MVEHYVPALRKCFLEGVLSEENFVEPGRAVI